MINLFTILFSLCLIAGNEPKFTFPVPLNSNSDTLYNVFEKSKHFKPSFNKNKFDTLHGWDFGWAILDPINIAKGREHEIKLSRRFSPGQKALYFFWYLDAQVTNGGFIQFYLNDYRRYLHPIKEGLKLIGDVDMLQLFEKADHEFLLNKNLFKKFQQMEDRTEIYNKLKKFGEFDSRYYEIHDKTMELIEQFARKNTDQFVKFK